MFSNCNLLLQKPCLLVSISLPGTIQQHYLELGTLQFMKSLYILAAYMFCSYDPLCRKRSGNQRRRNFPRPDCLSAPHRGSTVQTTEDLSRRRRTKTHSVFLCRCCAKMLFTEGKKKTCLLAKDDEKTVLNWLRMLLPEITEKHVFLCPCILLMLSCA